MFAEVRPATAYLSRKSSRQLRLPSCFSPSFILSRRISFPRSTYLIELHFSSLLPLTPNLYILSTHRPTTHPVSIVYHFVSRHLSLPRSAQLRHINTKCLPPVSVSASSRTLGLRSGMRTPLSVAMVPRDAASRAPKLVRPRSSRVISSACGIVPLGLRRCISGMFGLVDEIGLVGLID